MIHLKHSELLFTVSRIGRGYKSRAAVSAIIQMWRAVICDVPRLGGGAALSTRFKGVPYRGEEHLTVKSTFLGGPSS